MRRAGALVFLAGLWVVLSAQSASAHAVLRSSDPAEGSELEGAPPQVLLTFSEPPDVALSSADVLDTAGREVDVGEAEAVQGQPLQLLVPLGDLPEGVYTVTWRALSRTDGHITSGAFAFGVGVTPAGAGIPAGGTQTTPSPTPLAVAARWGIYAGLVVLLGAVVVGVVVARTAAVPLRWALVGAWGVAAVGQAALILSRRDALGVPLGTYLESDAGSTMVVTALALAAVAVAVATVVAIPRWTSLPALGLVVAGAMLAHVLAGHANAPSALRGVNLAVQWIHVLAVGTWIGGLLWLLVVLRRLDDPGRRAAVRRFSLVAGIALATVAATGLVRMLDEVGGPAEWGRLFGTSFGVALLVKIALFAGLAALGARNRYVNVPGVAGGSQGRVSSLRRVASAELAIAVGVFGATGVLTELPPADTPSGHSRPHAGPEPVTVEGSDFATTTRVMLTVTPGGTGPNRFDARVTDYDSGEPVAADRVTLRFTLPGRPGVGSSTLELQPGMGGRWSADGSNLSLEGIWRVAVVVQGSADSVEVEMALQPRPPPQDIHVARAPDQPTLYTVALPGGLSVQAYLDPGREGPNQVHFTFFDAGGDELPIEPPEVDAFLMSGSSADLSVELLTPGHLVAQGELVRGEWRFTVRTATLEGQRLSAYFETSVEAG